MRSAFFTLAAEVAALTCLAMIPISEGILSNVRISSSDQAGLELSFLLTWDTGAEMNTSAASTELINVWLITRQSDPSSWMETVVVEETENSGSKWVDAGDEWATRGTWDNTLSGVANVCVYNASNDFDNACAEALGILPADEAPYASPGEGISSVKVPRVSQVGSSLSFSLTWADGGDADGGALDKAGLVDIWLAARQFEPAAFVELPVKQNVENTKLEHVEVDMDWSLMGWDLSRDGELRSCVYDASDYDNNDCSDFASFTPEEFPSSSTEDGAVGDGDASSSSDGKGSSDDDGFGGSTVVASLIVGGLAVGLMVWVAVSSSRRRQRRRWLGEVNEAEALPDDGFARPSNPYSSF